MTVIEKKFGTEKVVYKYLVDEEHHGMRLDQFIQIYLATFSRQNIKKKIKNGDILISNRHSSLRPSTKVHHKEVITINFYKSSYQDEYWMNQKLEPKENPEIIFEDENILVVSKPPFVVTHPTGKHIFNCVTVYFESIYKKTIHSIHRLDRETSGVLLLAKNPETASTLTRLFENDQVKKCYFFISQINSGLFKDNNSFIAEERLGNEEQGLKRVYIAHYPKDSPLGKPACTKFKIFHQEDKYALGLAFPQTGRQHQIRVHAAIHGLPLLGDKLYCGSFEMFQRFKDNIATEEDHQLMQIPRHALHAMAINISYQNKNQTYISHLPLDLKEWIKTKLKINVDDLDHIVEKIIDHNFTH